MNINKQDVLKLKDLTVLYVEDETETKEIIKNIFSNYFKEVMTAKDGKEGLEKYKKYKPDIIISDIVMPNMDGLEMSAKIREHDLEQIIVFFTAYNEINFLFEAIRLGINGYILKPFEEKQFLISILNATRYLFYKREKEYIQSKLEYMAKYDPLTNLYQRNIFIEFLEKLMKRSDRTKELMAVLFLDLDNFKEINDTFGHDAGDCVLKRIANILINLTRKEDVVSRMSGDEFTIILWGLKEKNNIYKFLERLKKELEKPIICKNIKLNISISIGITFYPQGKPISANELLRQADMAMYYIKKHKKGNYFIFDPNDKNILNSIKKDDKIIIEIENAFSNNEFIIYYQPQIEIKTKKIKGYEALIRWNHPQKGILTPDKFLSYINDNEALMKRLSLYVIENVSKDILDFMNLIPDSEFSINITSYDIESEVFITYFKNILEKYNLPASKFIFELIETSALNDLLRAKKMFKQLKEIGTKIAIDDFGTGYASLSYIQNFDVDFIKIDTSFVSNMLKDEKSYEITRASIELAKIFGYKTVAEGVENKEILDELEKLGCDYAQGYYISKPLPKEKIINLIKNKKL